MGILDFLSGQFIDVIHWVDNTRDTMVWRFERYGHEIKYGAKLTVREGQSAVFVHEGQLADVFSPGLYMLETNNMPIMTSLQHWDHGFRSPFKSEIYFVNTTRFNGLKWGTKNPIICRDPEFGPVRLRAFGTYSVRVSDPARFLTEIVGTDGDFSTQEISVQIRNVVVQEVSRVLAASGIPVLDMAANTRDLGKLVTEAIRPVIADYGLEIPEFYVENISLPEAVEKALDKRTSMGPGQENQEYWIYVQRGVVGPKREFQVGIHYFHALNPGDRSDQGVTVAQSLCRSAGALEPYLPSTTSDRTGRNRGRRAACAPGS